MTAIAHFCIVCLLACLAAAPLSAAQSSATTLTVTANDTDVGDNALLTYSWSKKSGPGAAYFGATNGLHTGNSCTVAVDATGDYIFTVSVSDTHGGLVTSDTGIVHCTQAPLNTSAPTVAGTARVGQTATAITGVWTNPDSSATVSYTWTWVRANDATGTGATVIAGATASTYALKAADRGKYIAAVETATNAPYGANRTVSAVYRVVGYGVGDVDGNNAVTVQDLNAVKAAFGKSVGQAGYNAFADFDGNGSITVSDLNLTKSKFGTTYP